MNSKIYGARGLMALAAMACIPTERNAEHDAFRNGPSDLEPKIPKRLDIRTDSRQKCVQYEVYFNGERQRACIVADAEKGFILRYKLAIGSMPVKGRSGKYDTEHLTGRVEIKLKAPESV